MITFTAPDWVGIFIGAIIGGLAEIWGISNPEVLLKLSKWEDRLFINCIAIAIGAGAVLLYGLSLLGVGFHWGIKPLYVVGILIGGLLFGLGIAISGYVPGTVWMALGEGRRDAIFALLGGLLGASTWTVLYQTSAGQWLVNTLNFGEVYLGGKVATNLDIGFGIAIAWAIIMFLISYYLPRYKEGKSCIYYTTHSNYKMSDYELAMHRETSEMLVEGSAMPQGPDDRLAKSANEYWAPSSDLRGLLTFIGVIIGATVVLEMFLHQIFGESTTYSWIAGYLWLPTFSYSKLVFDTIGWEPYSDIGTLLGAFLAAVFVTRRFQAFNKWMPKTWTTRFGDSEVKRAFGAFIGAYLVLFGARMAGGCASGHILSGDLQMAVSSIEFFLAVMVSMLISSKLIYSRR